MKEVALSTIGLVVLAVTWSFVQPWLKSGGKRPTKWLVKLRRLLHVTDFHRMEAFRWCEVPSLNEERGLAIYQRQVLEIDQLTGQKRWANTVYFPARTAVDRHHLRESGFGGRKTLTMAEMRPLQQIHL